MIFKLTFSDGRIDWCTAKNQLHLLKSYDEELELNLQELESVEEISEDVAKTVMVRNLDYDEDDPNDKEMISLADLADGDYFATIASTEFD